MKLLLVYPPTPETFWSFKHVLPLVSRRAAFPPLGLLTVAGLLPNEWEIRLVDLNVEPLCDDDLRWADYVMLSTIILIHGYRDLMRRLYEPRHYYHRIRTFLERQVPRGPRLRLSGAAGLLAAADRRAAPAPASVPQSHGTRHHGSSFPEGNEEFVRP